MKQFLIAKLLATAPASGAFAWEEGAGYLELSDRQDCPEDGYCLDVAGSGDWTDFSVPLNLLDSLFASKLCHIILMSRYWRAL